ncbi:uncharacterized protein M6B38_126495 [Iris pallida]|uniref:Uncharacterized protein n=1 Tax=Iris pallida TaxID=29817 RepID=A0AAX6GGX8_IRIPA|nr:uncharacterized protein M6B38_126495 [Iris pallida]
MQRDQIMLIMGRKKMESMYPKGGPEHASCTQIKFSSHQMRRDVIIASQGI